MNKERILHLAALIEKLPHRNAKLDGFSMATYVKVANGCKTPSCIAGWAVHEFDPLPWTVAAKTTTLSEWPAKGRKFLGLTKARAAELFYPEGLYWRDITPAQAAACLRNLAETGKVDWAKAIKEFPT